MCCCALIGSQVIAGDDAADIVKTDGGIRELLEEGEHSLLVLGSNVAFEHDHIVAALCICVTEHRVDSGSQHRHVGIIGGEYHRNSESRVIVQRLQSFYWSGISEVYALQLFDFPVCTNTLFVSEENIQ